MSAVTGFMIALLTLMSQAANAQLHYADLRSAVDRHKGVPVLLLESPPNLQETHVCRGSARTTVRQPGGEQLQTIQIQPHVVFPQGSFMETTLQPVRASLRSGSSLVGWEDVVATLHCQPRDGDLLLPESLCANPRLNPGHRATCAMIPAAANYPWLSGPKFLGSCGCST